MVCNFLLLFIDTFQQILPSAMPEREAPEQLHALRQSRRSVMDYTVEFRTLAADSSWNQPALADAFHNGLSDTLEDQTAPLDLPSEINALVSLATLINKRVTLTKKKYSARPGLLSYLIVNTIVLLICSLVLPFLKDVFIPCLPLNAK